MIPGFPISHHAHWPYSEHNDDGAPIEHHDAGAPYPNDKANLPNGLYVMRTYTELKDGSSECLHCVAEPDCPDPFIWPKGGLWAQVEAANAVPEAQCLPDLLKKLDNEGPQQAGAGETVNYNKARTSSLPPCRRTVGWTVLKNGHPSWPRKVVVLLLEFHHVFSLEPSEIGCTDTTEHVIRAHER